MIPLFIGLTAFNLLALLATAALGYAGQDSLRLSQIHTLVGALATFACVAVHCVVITYFIATAKWVQHAVTVKKLDVSMSAPTRSFKMQAFPSALAGLASTFIAAILGAATDNRIVPLGVHHVAALVAVGINFLVAVFEYQAISRNGQLIDTILAAPTPAAATGT